MKPSCLRILNQYKQGLEYKTVNKILLHEGSPEGSWVAFVGDTGNKK